MRIKTAILTSLCVLLTACATAPSSTPTPKQALQPTPVPRLNGDTNEALALYAVELKAALQSCNADKASQ